MTAEVLLAAAGVPHRHEGRLTALCDLCGAPAAAECHSPDLALRMAFGLGPPESEER